MEFLDNLTTQMYNVIWALPLTLLALGTGLYFTLRMKFPQVRLFKDMLHYLLGRDRKREDRTSNEGMSSFQAFALALGGRVGVGNIAGVATAICFGGPGAVFWMWLIAFIGAGTAFSESALAQTYKTRIDGEYKGGPAYYIERGMGGKSLAKIFAAIFALAAILANGITGPTIQAFNFADAAHNAFGLNPWIGGIIMAICVAVVAFGGAKRLGRVSELIVPVMAIAYIIIALVILAINFKQIPEMFGLIFKGAFKMDSLYGAIWGSTVMWGVKRGIYSNEAGYGSGAHAAASAEVSHPAKQGLAQSFSVYVDTLFVCTATAIMILSTGMYNVTNEETGVMITENLPGVDPGVGYTQAAIDSVIPGIGSAFIAIAVFFFAFTTLLSFVLYTDVNISYLLRNTSEKTRTIWTNVFRMIIVLIVLVGATRSSAAAWNTADIGIGIMCWINFIALLILSTKAVKLLKDYERQKKMGLDPVFEPADIGVDNAELWTDIVNEKYADQLAAKHQAEGKAK
ncbi:MAG: alanine/glycine:cation symporter family protein [Emergencia sp.]|nr:alanine/glycine:cation symporter family protein [Emergencia sp.]